MLSSAQPAGQTQRTAHSRLHVAVARRLSPLLALTVVAATAALLALPSATLAWDANSFNSSSESELYALTNQARAGAGLPSLRVDSALASIARYRSKDMEDRGYFSHNIPPSGKMAWDVMDERGYCYNLAGENIGWNNYPDDEATAQIQRMFMDSAEHHGNIMGRAWDVMGIGAYKGADGHMMWTVLFADKSGCGSTPAATPKPTPKPTPSPTAAPVATPRPTATPTPRPTPTPTPKPTPTPTARPTPTPAPVSTPTPTPPPAATPGATPSATSTQSPSPTPKSLAAVATPVPTPTPPANWNSTPAPEATPNVPQAPFVTASPEVTFQPLVSPAPSVSPTPSVAADQAQPAGQTAQGGATLRVLEDPQPQGLLESILGEVARAFGL